MIGTEAAQFGHSRSDHSVIADMAIGRNSGPRHTPAPMSEMWHLE